MGQIDVHFTQLLNIKPFSRVVVGWSAHITSAPARIWSQYGYHLQETYVSASSRASQPVTVERRQLVARHGIGVVRVRYQ